MTQGSIPNANVAGPMPAIFLAHGSPFLLDDMTWRTELRDWSAALTKPRAILVLSAHWTEAPTTIGATETVPLVYDFYGFPQKYYEVTYRSPGAPALAARVRALVAATVDEPRRGLDHGAFVPLVAMYPAAEIPVLQVSLPSQEPAVLVDLGRRLAPLRDEGVLIVGSGFLTHNLREMSFEPNASIPHWASEFDAWTAEKLSSRDVDSLLQYRELAPGVRRALPTHEHFVPLLVSLGASLDRAESVSYPITGFAYGSGTKRSVQFG